VGEFIEYLEGKRIDASVFKIKDAELFTTWEREFMQMHPKSFTSQKLYLINNIRRLYLLPEDKVKAPVKKAKAKAVLPGAKKAIVAKPTIAKPKVAGEVKKPVVKPKIGVAKPVIKPKVSTNEGEPKKQLAKPKMPIKKPALLKPKIAVKPSTEGQPKKVLAPKIPTKKVPKKDEQ
jgi:hypothetical protein